VRRDTILGDLVHLLGADLDFQRLAVQADYGGVQRLVQVVLGHSDIVVELARDGPPQAVNDPQHVVALAHLFDNDAHAAHVIDLVEIAALGLHLGVDAIDVLWSAGDAGVDPLRLQALSQDADDAFQVGSTFRAALGEKVGDLAVLVRVEVAESEILELPLELPNT